MDVKQQRCAPAAPVVDDSHHHERQQPRAVHRRQRQQQGLQAAVVLKVWHGVRDAVAAEADCCHHDIIDLKPARAQSKSPSSG